MFRAAFRSAFKRTPQDAQENSLPTRVPRVPHREQSLLVYSGGTSTTRLPTSSHLYARNAPSCPKAHRPSLRLNVRPFLFSFFTLKSSKASTSKSMAAIFLAILWLLSA